MSTPPVAVVILAAGEGTRMKSATPKVLHRIAGRSLIGHAIAAARGCGATYVSVVVRHQRDLVADHVATIDSACLIADQDEVKGTARATECGLLALPAELHGTVLVTMGDVPLLTAATLRQLSDAHAASAAAVTVMTSHSNDPFGYGRIVRDERGDVQAIVEEKDATPEERAIREINSGIYAFDLDLLHEALAQVGSNNQQGERYLTDVVGIARQAGRRVGAHLLDDSWQSEGVNDLVQLSKLGRVLNDRICERHMVAGVSIVDPATTWIDADVVIEPGAQLRPGCQLLGATTIAAGAVIGPEVTLTDCEVGAGARITRAEAQLAVIGADASVGPYSYLRPGTILGARGKIGGFVETKNASIGEGAKVPHLTYCGDATIGDGANIGAGTIFANYDGVAKHHTSIGAHSFVGSNSVLVAPVTVADGAYVAAGSALTGNVGSGDIAVARARQRNIPGWVERARPQTKTAQAAKAARDAAAHGGSDADQ